MKAPVVPPAGIVMVETTGIAASGLPLVLTSRGSVKLKTIADRRTGLREPRRDWKVECYSGDADLFSIATTTSSMDELEFRVQDRRVSSSLER